MTIAALDDAERMDEDSSGVSCALQFMAELGLSARTRERGTARTLAGSVRSNEIHYT